MARTRHMATRMNQRGFTSELVGLAKNYGVQQEADGAQKYVLSRKGIDQMLRELDKQRSRLVKARDKGGVVVVASEDDVDITVYQPSSYVRSGAQR